MSVSDPLIKDIKGYTLNFLEEINVNRRIRDDSAHLVPFCLTLEKVYNSGIVRQISSGYFTKQTTPWSWLMSIVNDSNNVVSFAYRHCVDCVTTYKNVRTDAGKFRLLTRLCLAQKCLHVPLQYLSVTKKNRLYYRQSSILGDEILLEILLSILLQYSKMSFQIDIDNVSFLDYTWSLPKMVKLELVPTKCLGISISFSGDKAVIVNILPNSVAAEESSISIGDVLDNLNGQYINASIKGRISSLLKAQKKQPIRITIIKGFNLDTKTWYLPIKRLLANLRIDIGVVTNESAIRRSEKSSGDGKNMSAGYKVTYVGCVDVGKYGDTKLISKAMQALLSCNRESKYYAEKFPNEKLNKEVYFELQDMGVKIIDANSSEVLLQHSYMQISSCGTGEFLTRYFAYIAGNGSCNAASNFTCHIFFTKDDEQCTFILQSMGQGFHRTHFAV